MDQVFLLETLLLSSTVENVRGSSSLNSQRLNPHDPYDLHLPISEGVREQEGDRSPSVGGW